MNQKTNLTLNTVVAVFFSIEVTSSVFRLDQVYSAKNIFTNKIVAKK